MFRCLPAFQVVMRRTNFVTRFPKPKPSKYFGEKHGHTRHTNGQRKRFLQSSLRIACHTNIRRLSWALSLPLFLPYVQRVKVGVRKTTTLVHVTSHESFKPPKRWRGYEIGPRKAHSEHKRHYDSLVSHPIWEELFILCSSLPTWVGV